MCGQSIFHWLHHDLCEPFNFDLKVSKTPDGGPFTIDVSQLFIYIYIFNEYWKAHYSFLIELKYLKNLFINNKEVNKLHKKNGLGLGNYKQETNFWFP